MVSPASGFHNTPVGWVAGPRKLNLLRTDVRQSVLGERCAFESQTYLDEDTMMTAVDADGNPLILIGSPGIFQQLGDLNCDGQVSLLDVALFVEALTSADFVFAADINQDGVVNLLDVSPFVDLLAG